MFSSCRANTQGVTEEGCYHTNTAATEYTDRYLQGGTSQATTTQHWLGSLSAAASANRFGLGTPHYRGVELNVNKYWDILDED